ncbi:MAG TPA: P-loop NTPase, partial [Bdellovibrionales bacterium]|nr:P-loop NTPase [Bdellovibrionales bacterium]
MSLFTGATRKLEQPQTASATTVWAFGGGKGGIGKSFLTSNLAVCMAQTGHSVTLVDLDFAGANLHTCVGNDLPKLGLSDFLQGRVNNLKELVVESKISRLQLVGGVNDNFTLSQFTEENKKRLMEQIRELPGRNIFIDLGAGATELNAEFFTYADQSVLITTPEPTSIENTYQYVRMAFHRKVKQVETKMGAQELFNRAMEQRVQLGIRTPSDLVKYVMRTEPEVGAVLRSELDRFKLKLILNQVRTKHDVELGHAIKTVCRQYFGINSEILGFLDFDNAAWQSARKKQPLVLAFPFSHLAGNLFNIA